MKIVTHATRALRRRWSDRKAFGSSGSWLLSLYDSAVRFSAKRMSLPLRGSARPLLFRSLNKPVYVRIGTSDAAMAEEIFVRDVYAHVKPELFDHPIRLIIDLGANCGMTVRLWAQRFPHARIVAVEPDPENAQIAKLNAREAEIDAAFVEACVAEVSGRVNFSAADDACAYHIDRSGDRSGRWVDAVTMDSLLAQYTPHNEPVDLLKCDIEGAEEEVFRDCRSWIGRVRALVIELHGAYSRERFLSDLTRNGSRLVVVEDEVLYGNVVLTLRQVASPGAANL